MWLTAQEAFTLLCPLMAAPINSARCRASSCPMWRWLEQAPLAGLGQTYDIGEPQAVPLEHEQQRERRGYCGLAGKPECFR